jgi:signal transduction histidine kinase
VNGNDQAQELITIALEEVSRMAKLTRQMLDFYRGSLDDVAHQPVDMRSLLHEVDMMHRESLVKQNIRLRCDVAAELPLVPGSRDKLKQVFINLLSNARDAMPSGGTIVVAACVEQDYVTVTVTDSGIGIAQSDLGKIFDAFYTTKKERSGVGLGLSVTYGIIRQHKGVINVKSTPGQGTTFTIQLPSMSRVNDSQTIG